MRPTRDELRSLFLFERLSDEQLDWLGERFVRDGRGFVLTGLGLLDDEGRPPADWPLERDPYLLESSVPGVFVAGDVRAASMKRVASAVGDGAMAVSMVHTYLEGT